MPWVIALLTILAAYLIGAIPFGFLIARTRGINIFEQGSGNIGATNVGRSLGFRFGVLVFILDFAKGAAPVVLAMLLRRHFDDPLWTRGYVEVAAGLTAFLGHVFPIYLRFHGGKGVAAGCGAVMVLMPIPTLAALVVWFAVLLATRYMSFASIAAVFALTAVQLRQANWQPADPRTWFCVVAGTLVIVRHHANIARLWNGTENRLQETPVMQQLCKSLHTLALGLWFGMSVFFTFVVAVGLFDTFEGVAQQETPETWFPRPPYYRSGNTEINAPKEQGTRAAGYAVGPMFSWYFALQGLCGFIGLATALTWSKEAGGVHRWRVNLLIGAIVCVLAGWPIEQHVTVLRVPRNEATEAHLKDRDDPEKVQAMKDARGEFLLWHFFSLALNFGAIVFVTGAIALAGNLPSAVDKVRRDDKAVEAGFQV